MSATLAVDVMLSLGLASSFELPFGEAIKLVQNHCSTSHFDVQVFCVSKENIDSLLEVQII